MLDDLDQATLKSILVYHPESGLFTRAKGSRKGQLASTGANNKGYVSIRVHSRKYRAHRLAWLYMTGRWPTHTIDHINRVRNDNRWINLREATFSQQAANTPKRSTSTSPYKGVKKKSGRWWAFVYHSGTRQKFGPYETPEEARSRYIEAATKIHGEYLTH